MLAGGVNSVMFVCLYSNQGLCKEKWKNMMKEKHDAGKKEMDFLDNKPFWKSASSDITSGCVHLDVWWIDEQRLLQSTG